MPFPKTIEEKYGICKSALYRLHKKTQAEQRIIVKDYTAGQIAILVTTVINTAISNRQYYFNLKDKK